MELDSLLIQVQGVLISLKRNNGLKRDPLDKNIKNSAFCQSLNRILNTCNHGDHDMRRVHLYLLLNSDFKFNEALKEEENFSHIVSTSPAVDKLLLVQTLLMLEFQKYMNETIIFGHISIAVEYLEVICTVLETESLMHFIPLVESFLAAIYRKLCLLVSDDSMCKFELELVRKKFSLYFRKLLALFSPPHDKCKMGYVVKSLLSLLSLLLDNDYDLPFPANSDRMLYVMSLPNVQHDSYKTVVDFNEGEDIHQILYMLKSNLLQIDLNIWMDWFEMEWKSTERDSTTRNMQIVIGEVAYICKEKLHTACGNIPEVEEIITVLSEMAIKPYSEDEDIQETENLVKILLKVKDDSLLPESRKKWLIAMLSIPKSLTENECFKCVQEFGSYLTYCKEMLLLLERVAELISDKSPSYSCSSEKNSNEVEDIKRTLLSIFSQVSLEDQGKIMALYFEKCGLSDIFAMKNCEESLTEYLNKVVNTSSGKEGTISESYILCLQSPKEYFQGLLGIAICNDQLSFVMSVLIPLSDLCQLRLESHDDCKDGVINKNVKFLCKQIKNFMKERHWNEAESSNFVQFVIQILECAILHQDDIFQEILYPCMKEFLENEYWNSVDLCIKTMYEVITKFNISPVNYCNPAVTLAVLLQVLERGRQQMKQQFSSPAASTCELLTSFLPQIVEKFIGGNFIEGKNLEWLKARIMCSFPLSKIYFSRLLDNMNGDDICKSIQSILMLSFFQSTEVTETKLLQLLRNQPKKLTYLLFKLLPSCTTSEWINLFHALIQTTKLCQSAREQNYLIANFIISLSNILLVMVKVVSKRNSSEKKECLHIIELYMKNFVRIIKEEFWQCTKYFGLKNSCEVFQNIVNLLELIPNYGKVQEACGSLVLNILCDIIQSVACQNSQNDPEILHLASSISLISELETRKCLSRMLMEYKAKYSYAA